MALLFLTANLPNFKAVKSVNIPPVKKAIFADVNHDGLQDILISTDQGLSLYENDGHGFYIEMPVYVPGQITDFTLADLNGDGSKDIAIINSGSKLQILKNTGIDGFRKVFSHSLVSSGATSVSVIDFNRDGILDLYISNPEHGDVVFLGEGGFEFVPMALQFLSREIIPVQNQAGLLEYLLTSPGFIKTAGKENGIPPQILNVLEINPAKVMIMDMNSDGKLDYVIMTKGGLLELVDDSTETLGDNVIDFSIGDYDMDGYPDIAVIFKDHSFSILKNLGNNNFEPNTFLSISDEVGRAIRVYTTDFNGDNIPDLIFYNGNSFVFEKNELQETHFLGLKIYPVSNAWLSVTKLYSGTVIETRVYTGDKLVFGIPRQIDSLEIYLPDSGITTLYELSPDTTYKISITETSGEAVNPDTGLLKLYPNPTGALTSLEYTIKTPEYVKIELINSGGQTLYLIDSGFKGSGTHRLLFNAEDLKPGTYFIRAIIGKNVYQKKLIVLK